MLIVDDEPLARQALALMLEPATDIEVIGQCVNGDEAVQRLRGGGVDLVFLDVQMPGLSGFDVVQAIGEAAMPLTIFVTAHDEHALRAFEASALDYLLKPVEDERFATALNRVRRLLVQTRAAAQVEREPDESGDGWLTFKAYGRLIRLEPHEIEWIEAANYCSLIHVADRTYLLRESMSSLDALLSDRRFVRIHRSCIVNVDRIREVQPLQYGDHVVILRDGSQHRLARTRRRDLEAALGTSI